MNKNDIKKWFDQIGEIFLIDVGVKQNHSVIDFGCGKGNYTIPAARIVGKRGKVYAIDKNKESLDEFTSYAKIDLDYYDEFLEKVKEKTK